MQPREEPQKRVTLRSVTQFALIAGPFLSMVDSSVVNVAIPAIATSFHSSLAGVQWVLTGYLLSLAAVLSASAYLSKKFGPKKVYFWSIVGFTAASLCAAISPNLDFLIAARIVQGSLGAPMVPVAMDLLFGGQTGQSGKTRTAQISPSFGMVLFLAPAIGPSLGGYLISYTGWQSIFLINVPIGIFSAALSLRIPINEEKSEKRSLDFDFLGFSLISIGLVLATYAASEGPLIGWFSTQAFAPLVASLALIGAYSVWAVRKVHPAVNLKLVSNQQSALALTICTIAAIVLFGVLFLLPVFMESFQGLSAFNTGLVLLPQGLLTGIGALIGDKLPGKIGVRSTVLLGMGILSASTLGMVAIGATTLPWLTAGILCGRGLALGLCIQPLLTSSLGRLPKDEISDGNTLFNIFDRLSGTIAISLLGTYFESRVSIYLAQGIQPVSAGVGSFHDSIILLALASLVGLVMSFFIKDGDSFGWNLAEDKTQINPRTLPDGLGDRIEDDRYEQTH
jgi:EmrB/QacA subfamily drug resistance transporter